MTWTTVIAKSLRSGNSISAWSSLLKANQTNRCLGQRLSNHLYSKNRHAQDYNYPKSKKWTSAVFLQLSLEGRASLDLPKSSVTSKEAQFSRWPPTVSLTEPAIAFLASQWTQRVPLLTACAAALSSTPQVKRHLLTLLGTHPSIIVVRPSHRTFWTAEDVLSRLITEIVHLRSLWTTEAVL